MLEYLITIFKTQQDTIHEDRRLHVVLQMGQLVVGAIVVGGIVQHGDVPETEESEQQHEARHELHQSGCTSFHELPRHEMHT